MLILEAFTLFSFDVLSTMIFYFLSFRIVSLSMPYWKFSARFSLFLSFIRQLESSNEKVHKRRFFQVIGTGGNSLMNRFVYTTGKSKCAVLA